MTLPAVVVGYDPGASGAAVAVRSADRTAVWVRDVAHIGGRLSPAWAAQAVTASFVSADGGGVLWVLETPMTKAGVQSIQTAATSATNFGVMLGVLSLMGAPYEETPPAAWKTRMRLTLGAGAKPKAKKELAVRRAVELMPGLASAFTSFGPRGGVTLHDGRAEAALIALDAISRKR